MTNISTELAATPARADWRNMLPRRSPKLLVGTGIIDPRTRTGG